MDTVSRRIAGARRGPAETIRSAAGTASGPLNVSVAKLDIEVAGALVDQHKLEGIKFVRALVVVSNVVPSDGHHAIGGVQVIIDCACAPRVDIRPERRDDRVVEAGSDCRRRESCLLY